jgi:hypothetical protein
MDALGSGLAGLEGAFERLWIAFVRASSRGKNQALALRFSMIASLEKSTPISKSPLLVHLP